MSENTKVNETEFVMAGVLAIARLLSLGPAHVKAIVAGIRKIADDLDNPPTHEDAREAARASWQKLIADLQTNDAEADARVAAAFSDA